MPLELILLGIGLVSLILGAFVNAGLLLILLSLSVFPLLTVALACYVKGAKGLVYLLINPLLYMFVSLITFLVAGFSPLESLGQLGQILKVILALFAPVVVGIIVLATSIIGCIVGFLARVAVSSKVLRTLRRRRRREEY